MRLGILSLVLPAVDNTRICANLRRGYFLPNAFVFVSLSFKLTSFIRRLGAGVSISTVVPEQQRQQQQEVKEEPQEQEEEHEEMYYEEEEQKYAESQEDYMNEVS